MTTGPRSILPGEKKHKEASRIIKGFCQHIPNSKHGQGGDADVQPRDLRAQLLEAEAAHFSKNGGTATKSATIAEPTTSSKRQLEAGPGQDEEGEEDVDAKRRRVLEETRHLDAESDESSNASSEEDSDDEEDETAELLRELEKIKKERAEKQAQEVLDQSSGALGQLLIWATGPGKGSGGARRSRTRHCSRQPTSQPAQIHRDEAKERLEDLFPVDQVGDPSFCALSYHGLNEPLAFAYRWLLRAFFPCPALAKHNLYGNCLLCPVKEHAVRKTMPAFVRQVWTPFEKDLLIVAARRPISTAIRAFILPLAIVLIVSYAQYFLNPPQHSGVRQPGPVLSLSAAIPRSSGERNSVAFVDNGLTGGDIEAIIEHVATSFAKQACQYVVWLMAPIWTMLARALHAE
ncbi:MAG: hypothetical protein Q9221_000157 [Calogaya cf. arnoldii]